MTATLALKKEQNMKTPQLNQHYKKLLSENPVILAEKSPNISNLCRGDWLDILQKYVGGHHVAVHFHGSLERDLMFTCPTVRDWN